MAERGSLANRELTNEEFEARKAVNCLFMFWEKRLSSRFFFSRARACAEHSSRWGRRTRSNLLVFRYGEALQGAEESSRLGEKVRTESRAISPYISRIFFFFSVIVTTRVVGASLVRL